MSKKHEWIKHIAHTHADMKKMAWCGEPLTFDWAFENIDHAAYNGMGKGRLVACKACTDAVIRCVTEGQEET